MIEDFQERREQLKLSFTELLMQIIEKKDRMVQSRDETQNNIEVCDVLSV